MSRRRTPWLIGWEAAKANAAPAFVLQSVMLAILLAYYFHPPSAALLNALADFKQRHGLTFVLIASVIVGALLPELFVIMFFQRGRIRLQNARNFVFNAPFWTFDGFLVNLMYRAMAEWLGDRTSAPLWPPKSVSTNSATIRFLPRLTGSGDTRGRTLGIPSRNCDHCSPGNI